MHFVILSQYYEPEVGAAQSRLSALARGVREAGHEVTVITAMPNYPTGRILSGYRRRLYADELIDGVRVLRLPLYPATGRGIQRLLNYATFTASCILGLMRCARPDVLFIESPPLTLAVPGILAARLRSSKVVFNVADPWPDVAVELGVLKPGVALRAFRRLELWAYRSSDLVTTATEGVRDRLLERGAVEAGKLHVLPNGADTSRFGPDRGDPDVLETLGLPSSGLLVYAGTMGYLHGLENLIRAAQIASGEGVHLALVGGGSELVGLKDLAREISADNVSFIDPIAPDELARLLPLADLGVVSLADIASNEVVRSAKMFPVMASGRPVLHVGLGEGARLVEEAHAGVVVPNRDPDAIAAAAVELLRDPAGLKSMGEAGRSYVLENLSWTSIVQSLLVELDDTAG